MTYDYIHVPKRLKVSSEQGAALLVRSSAALNLLNISINDLPDDVLVEILHRVGCYKSIAHCKCVSKRWCNLRTRKWSVPCQTTKAPRYFFRLDVPWFTGGRLLFLDFQLNPSFKKAQALVLKMVL